jgi:phosphohistidine swiveling domain-containing protein
VLGVLDATQHIPDGAQCAVDGVAGVVRWLR